MTGKQAFQGAVGVAGLALLVVCGLQTKDVAYGASEFTGTGGPLTGAGLLAGASGLLYSLVTLGKKFMAMFSGGQSGLGDGIRIFESLVSGKMDAFGVTKNIALAILFADAVNTGDQSYIELVRSIAHKAIPSEATPQPSPAKVA